MSDGLKGPYRSALGSPHLSVEDFPPGVEAKVEIDFVDDEEVANPRTGEISVKPVIHFKGTERGLVLNHTNGARISIIAGSINMEDWTGTKITLRRETGKTYGGGKGPTVRVKQELPK